MDAEEQFKWEKLFEVYKSKKEKEAKTIANGIINNRKVINYKNRSNKRRV